MPLLRAADPPSGVIRKRLEVRRFEQLGADRPAAVGGIGRVERLLSIVVEFNEAGVLDAVRLGLGDRKDHPFAELFVRPEDHFDLVAIGPWTSGF